VVGFGAAATGGLFLVGAGVGAVVAASIYYATRSPKSGDDQNVNAAKDS